MRLTKFGFLAVLALAACANIAGATHILDTGSGYQTGPLYITVLGHNGDQSFFNASGSIGLPPNNGSIDGVQVPYLYCVEIFTDINVRGTYGADLSSTGVVHGGLVPDAGSIAWLMDNIAPTALSQDQQEGLQAAIWQQVYGADFSVDSVNTGAGIYANYLADIAALGSNTAPVSDVVWISPYNSDGSPAQGLITSAVPEPSALVLIALGVCTLAGRGLRKRSS